MFATIILKFIRIILKLSGRGRGTALPGLIGEKYFYKSLSKLPSQLDKIIIITGTNGKTTTSKIIRTILKQNNIKVISNISGANLTRGILAALAFDTTIFGKLKSKVGVFEIEEASMQKSVKLLNPNIAVITNLFRDQMDAYGELDHTREVIENGLKEMSDNSIILLNANDPKVSYMNRICKGKVLYYGLDDLSIPTDLENAVPDSIKSPDERSELIYSKIFFSHIGLYKSKDNKFSTPNLNYHTKNYSINNLDGKSSFILEDNKNKINISVKDFSLLGIYNLINCLSAFAVLSNLDDIKNLDFSNISAAFGRGEKIDLKNGNSITLILVKNPTGFNSALGAINDIKDKNIIFALNDNIADSRDVSWIWDCNYEAVRDFKKIVVAGDRGPDLALRCKYANLPYFLADSYEKSLREFFEYKDEDGLDKTRKNIEIYALCSYTALLDFRRYLSTITKISSIEKEV